MKQKLSESELSEKTVNQPDTQGNTPLHHAVLNSSTDYLATTEPNFTLIEKLLSLGADVQLKNNDGLHAGALIDENNHKFVNGLQYDASWAYMDKMNEYRKKYFDLVIKYQPSFENIQLFLESEYAIPSQIKISELSQDCLEKLINWCKKCETIYKETWTPSDTSRVPSYLYRIKNIKAFCEACEKELRFLQKYPYLPEIIEKIVDRRYREPILIALTQDETIKKYFDSLTAQLKELPLAENLKNEIQTLIDELTKRAKNNYPQFTCLNSEGKMFIYSLFAELEETLDERQIQLAMQEASSSVRWQNTNIQDKNTTDRYKQYKPEHEKIYHPVLSQILTFDRNQLNKVKKPETTGDCTQSSSSSTSSTSTYNMKS